jgi:uncharacterized protein with FMN-binding domain
MNDDIERRNAEVNPERKTRAPAKAASKESRGKKITRRLVVASAAAILTVYAAGYTATQSAASQIAAQATSPVALAQTATSGGSPTASSVPSPTTIPTATAMSALTAASTASTYKDGTYSGTGVSAHGSIQAKVVIQNGKIVSAQITASTTRYPTSRIASLPGEVVSAQSPNVNYVSAATDSSTAYLQAVANALAQAA